MSEAPDPRDFDAYRNAYADALPAAHLRLAPHRATLDWPPAIDFDRPLWPVLQSAWILLIANELPKIRRCGGTGCGYLFIDQTRNASRRWCSADDCGRRERVRRHRARHTVRTRGENTND